MQRPTLNADALKNILDDMGPLPLGAKLFAADAKAMCTNMDTKHVLFVLKNVIDSTTHLLPKWHPRKLLIAALKEMMTNHLFQFGDTNWRQISGAAMGASCAVNCATLCFADWENKNVLSGTLDHVLKLCKRHIDDVFGTWLPHVNSPLLWHLFKQCLDECRKLRWKVCRLSDSVVFLDLEIWTNKKPEGSNIESTKNL